jgi:hypothetical protein
LLSCWRSFYVCAAAMWGLDIVAALSMLATLVFAEYLTAVVSR